MHYPLHCGEVFVRRLHNVLCDGSGKYHITQLVLYMELTYDDMDEVVNELHTTLYFSIEILFIFIKITEV